MKDPEGKTVFSMKSVGDVRSASGSSGVQGGVDNSVKQITE